MKNKFYLCAILVTVFLTGAAILVIEIAATRILAPYFGNTIFTFSSVISIILAALSIGYYFGGRLADRNPSTFLFYGVITAGGITILLEQALALTLLPAIAYDLSMIHGPLISSVMLFLLPAILLGMLSPFAIKLLHVHTPDKGVGHLAGLAFFWSTVGCIVGSLGAGFVLIPSWGTNAIVLATGTGLVLLGSIGLIVGAKQRGMTTAAVLMLSFVSGVTVLSSSLPSDASVAYSKHGWYEKITVQNGMIGSRPVRMLAQDLTLSSGMYVDDGSMVFDYTKYFDLYRLFVPKLETTLSIGGGAYSVPKAILQDTKATVDVAEVEPLLLPIAHTYFGLPKDRRLRNHVMDGRRFLYDSPGRYDLIFSDVYGSIATVPMQFTTSEFFRLAHDKLNDGGVFIGNYMGSLGEETRPMLLAVLKTMQSVFPQVYVFATSDPNSEKLQNFMFIGHKQDARIDLRKAANIKFAYPLLNNSARLEYRPDPEQLAAVLVFTDDYAPVEHYASKLVRLHPTLRR